MGYCLFRTNALISASHRRSFMTTHPFKISVIALLMIGWAGCELVHIETETSVSAERTYPLTFDLRTLDLSAARTSTDVPDSFNVEVRTLGVHVCPEKRRCYLPDGITVAQLGRGDSPLDTLRLVTEQPHQFEVYQSYIMSLEVLRRTEPDSTGGKTVDSLGLIGYNPIETVPAARR